MKVKLDKLKNDLNIKNLQFVVEKLGIQLLERFKFLFSVNDDYLDAIIALVTIPSIKLRWLNVYQEIDYTASKELFLKLIIQKFCELFDDNVLEGSDTNLANKESPENTFFNFKEDENWKNYNKYKKTKPEKDSVKNKLELELL